MAALNTFISFNKYITNQNHKGKGYTFKDFILGCSENYKARQEITKKAAKMMHYPPY